MEGSRPAKTQADRSSKEAAELRLGEIRRALVEERYIDRDKGARMSLGELVRWYHTLPEVEAKRAGSETYNSSDP